MLMTWGQSAKRDGDSNFNIQHLALPKSLVAGRTRGHGCFESLRRFVAP